MHRIVVGGDYGSGQRFWPKVNLLSKAILFNLKKFNGCSGKVKLLVAGGNFSNTRVVQNKPCMNFKYKH